MTEPPNEAYGPRGEPSRHRALFDLQSALSSLRVLPADTGRLALIVCRRADGVRETPDSVHLSPESGVPGDRWGRRQPRNVEAQLAVMRRDVAELIAGGQPLTVFGDNLFVDLDLSAAGLPAGSRLRLGEAVVEVTPKPHNGCAKFRERFGVDALRLVQAKQTRHLNLRGIYWRVVEPGIVTRGDSIRVMTRPASSAG